jgi:hypothetical protein
VLGYPRHVMPEHLEPAGRSSISTLAIPSAPVSKPLACCKVQCDFTEEREICASVSRCARS